MGPLAAQQKPKLWQLNYFTDKAELEALGPKRRVVMKGGKKREGKVHGETGKHSDWKTFRFKKETWVSEKQYHIGHLLK